MIPLPEPATLVLLVLLGGWVAIDSTSVGQFMISRPFVAATLAGWLVGDPLSGAMVGAVLEAFHLGVLPFGAARYPEPGPSAVVAGAAYGMAPHLSSILLTVIVFALAWEWLGGESVRFMRQWNVRLVGPLQQQGRVGELEWRHWTAVGLDVVRGMVLVAGGGLVLLALLAIAERGWEWGEALPRVVVGAALAGLLASSARFFSGRVPWYLAGVVAGLALAALS